MRFDFYGETLRAARIPVYSYGCHRVGGDEHRHALGEGHDGAHKASEWPVIQHQPDLNITFYESFDIADLAFVVIIARYRKYIYAMFGPQLLKVRKELFSIHIHELKILLQTS